MRLTSSFVCLAAAGLLTACGSKYVQGGRPDTGERITVIVENQAERFATVSFSWQRDQPFPFGRVESGSEETWETTWQDLPFRLAVERPSAVQAFTQELRPQPGDTVRLLITEGFRMVASVEGQGTQP